MNYASQDAALVTVIHTVLPYIDTAPRKKAWRKALTRLVQDGPRNQRLELAVLLRMREVLLNEISVRKEDLPVLRDVMAAISFLISAVLFPQS